ncbi:putative hydro-lyase [Streptomyces sp. NBC_00210]
MTTVAHPGALTPAQARTMFREGTSQPTGGWCAAYTQVNLISVPSDWAHDVHMFCRQNPKPCPVLDIADLGSWNTALAPGADLRTDLPLYHVWEHGRLIAEQTDVVDLWREDLVTFLIGCSFTFESALTDAGVPLRHVSQGANVAMYVTDHECRPGGRLRGPLVVSMRQVPAGLVDTATRVTAQMPAVHGGPVHIGDPAGLGIQDFAHPDFGDPVEAEPGDVPMFWACGVTPQAALMASRPPFAITHAPGHMLITDARDTDYRVG